MHIVIIIIFYKIYVHIIVLRVAHTGLCSMDNTNAQDQEQNLQEEWHGRENSLMRKLNPLFHLTSLMALNGSECNSIYLHYYSTLTHSLHL